MAAAARCGADSDVDVVKANHHGPDTSNDRELMRALDPEVAVVSVDFPSDHRLPKLVSIKRFIEAGAVACLTGDGLDANGRFAQSSVADDKDHTPAISRRERTVRVLGCRPAVATAQGLGAPRKSTSRISHRPKGLTCGRGDLAALISRLSGGRGQGSDSGNFSDFKAIPHDLHGIEHNESEGFSV